MEINKQKVTNFLAFTLAEVLITMIIITLMTLASIPVIKKSKEFRETAKETHSWYATYDKDNKLVVVEDGNVKTGADYIGGSGDNQYAKFTPPKGVSKFNVTVIGGGGGGAAGETGVGSSRIYFPDTEDRTFTPVKTQEYQIIAIGGGGGGGGGGAAAGAGGGGYSGGVVIARATLEKNKTYAVLVGAGGGGGHTDSVLGVIGGFLTGLITTPINSTLGFFGAEKVGRLYQDMLMLAQPSSKWDGGGHGVSSMISGEGLEIEAGGGCGGAFRYWGTECKWFVCYPKKKWSGGCDGGYENKCDGASCITNWAPQRRNPSNDFHSGGVVCESADKCYPTNLAGNLEGDVSGYGNGGHRGGSSREGKPGADGYIQIRETPVYGGGGGQAGNVSLYTFNRSPVDEKSGKEYIEVYIGKGGAGATEKGAKGTDGQFSRFGTRIIADGGKGGVPRVNSMETATSDYKVKGENGASTAIPKSLIQKIGITANTLIGGLNSGNENNIDGQGFGTNQATPGAGGAGGGGQGDKNYVQTNMKYGKGGNGSPGIVIVTW